MMFSNLLTLCSTQRQLLSAVCWCVSDACMLMVSARSVVVAASVLGACWDALTINTC
jgi:hypothetical protein